MSAKVSVIIPVYGAEKTIEKCAESLFTQTLDEIEYIFVNDCTPDRSMELLYGVMERFPSRKSQVKIVGMQVNSRQAAARNAGLAQATGDYVIHCDPDDWVDTKLYQEMYELAVRDDLEIVSCDYVVENKDNTQHVSLPHASAPSEILCSARYYIMSLWAHMVRRKIIHDNQLRFFADINCSEDVGFMARVFALSHTIGHISSNSYYHYLKSDQSITNRLDHPEIIAQRIMCLNLIDIFMIEHGLDISRQSMLLRLKRDIKNLFLKKDTLDRWVKLFPEVSEWECRQPGTSLIYKVAYKLSHKIGTWPMKLLLTLHS